MDNERDDVEMSSTAEYTLSQACRFKAERDEARQRLQGLEEWTEDLEDSYREAWKQLVETSVKEKRLGKLVWRLQNRLSKAHRREKSLRKGMREWREKAISGPVRTVSAYDLLSEGEREVLRMWPRYEGGEPVRFGDRVKYRRGTCVVESVRLYIGGGVSVYGNDSGKRAVVTEQAFRDPVERADAQVLAADGEPLEVGQTVWDMNGDELVIGAFENGGNTVTCRYADIGDSIPTHGMWSPSDLTHQRPVLDADGVLIREGDTVWNIDDGTELYVYDIDPKWGVGVSWLDDDGEKDTAFIDPGLLAHTKPEPPDSWERIEEDKDLNPFDYCKKVGHKLWTFDNAEEFKASDLVRRCKALAERDE